VQPETWAHARFHVNTVPPLRGGPRTPSGRLLAGGGRRWPPLPPPRSTRRRGRPGTHPGNAPAAGHDAAADRPTRPDPDKLLDWCAAELPILVAICQDSAQHGPHDVAWLIADGIHGYCWLQTAGVPPAGQALATAGTAALHRHSSLIEDLRHPLDQLALRAVTSPQISVFVGCGTHCTTTKLMKTRFV